MGRLGSGMGGLGGVESAGAGPSPRKDDPTLTFGIDGTEGGHLSSVYDWFRQQGTEVRRCVRRARPEHH